MTKTNKQRRRKKGRTPNQQRADTASSESIRIGREFLSSRQASLTPLPRLSATRFDVLLREATASIKPDEATQTWMQIWVNAVEQAEKPVPGLPHQDHASYQLVSRLLRRVEAACARLGINPLSDAVVGTLQADGVNAFNASFFGSTSLIVLHHRSLIFVWLLVKCILPVIACPANAGVVIGQPSPQEYYEPAITRMRELALAMRVHRDPSCAPVYIQPPGWIFEHLAQLFARCIELFIVAHEYGHLIVERGDGSFPVPSVEEPSTHHEEYVADFFAYLIVLCDADEQSPAPWALSPLIFFKFLSLLERDGVVPSPIDHPSGADRLATLVAMFDQLSSNTQPPAGARGLLFVWNRVNDLLDHGWSLATQEAMATSTTQQPGTPDGAPSLAPPHEAPRK